MKRSDNYHKWVEWSEEDQVYIGKYPDLITGIHGDDPIQLYGELCEVVEEDNYFLKGAEKMDYRSLPLTLTEIDPLCSPKRTQQVLCSPKRTQLTRTQW